MLSKVIAIDGPCGGGKSTIAKRVSEELKIIYIDTGAMYRAIGLACERSKIAFLEGENLTKFLNKMDLRYATSVDKLIEVNGEDYSEAIRSHSVSKLASQISKLPTVRDYLVNVQRNLAKEKFCIMEGRDIGTIVFPNAFCKIYLTAELGVRAARRLDQLIEKGDHSLTLAQVEQDVERRDQEDMNRTIAPLKQAVDALFLDSTQLSLDQVVTSIINIAKKRAMDNALSL